MWSLVCAKEAESFKVWYCIFKQYMMASTWNTSHHTYLQDTHGRGSLLLITSTLTVKSLVRRTERARAVTMVFGSLDVGSVVGLLASGPLIARFGWPSVFYLFAVLGLLWACAWPLCKPGQSDPECPMVPLNSPQPETNNTDAKPQSKHIPPHFSFNHGLRIWNFMVNWIL